MAYIGKEPIVGNFQKCDAITVVNGQAAYTLQVSSTNVTPESANHMLVSLNGILQAPITSFSVSGSTLTFVSNLATGDVIDFVILLGNVLDLGTPSDGTVTPAKLSGVTEGIKVADQWRLTTNFTGDADPIASNWERADTSGQGTIGSAMAESSGIFTFPSTGIYLVRFTVETYLSGDNRYTYIYIKGTTNNSSYAEWTSNGSFIQQTSSDNTASSVVTDTLVDVTDVANVKVQFRVNVLNSSTNITGDTDKNRTYATFIRLGDT